MLESDLKSELSTRVLNNTYEILKYLHLGINIPILPDFYKYILEDLNSYEAKAIILEKNMNEDIFKTYIDKVVGNVLVYDDQGDTLFFGYFGVYDHEETKIEFLIDELIEYAKNNNYKAIRGPINIPTVIYGWGFMVEGSTKDLFIGCPVNPPIYQEIFLKKGFNIKFEINRYHVPAMKLDPHHLPNYDFTEYEYVTPGKERIWDVLDDILKLHVEFQPPSAQITPKKSFNFKYFFDFIYTFGKEWMIWTVYYKPTGKMVASGYVTPNIFHKDRRGRMDSISFHDWVVHPDHRRKGLAMLMYGETSLRGINKETKNYIKWGYWPVGSENNASIQAAKKMGGVKSKAHLILELKL
ncbi:MAG: GNAT family N-acetyltransferase [Candidatus Hodarchaeota archaeon]